MSTMMKFRRIAELWNWLPGFRAVGEHESVHKAAQTLHTSPSALSRTVKLLEAALGATLFVRHGSGMQLTPLGAELLTVTRDVMRQVDDCIARAETRDGRTSPFYVAVTSDVAAASVARAIVIPTDVLQMTHVVHLREDAIAEELLQGNVDLVVTTGYPRSVELASERIGDTTYGVYAARDHALAREPMVTAAQVEDHPFVATTTGPHPQGHSHKVTCYCDSAEVARAICESSTLLCVLPDVMLAGAGTLRRVASFGDPVPLYALRRHSLPTTIRDPRSVELLARLRAILEAGEP